MRYRTSRFVALEHDFGVRSDDPALIERIGWAYEDLAALGEPVCWYDIPSKDDDAFPHEVRRGGTLIASGLDQGHALAWLQWEVNRCAANSANGAVLHAAAAAGTDGAVVVIGRSGAGKSTIVAELARAGMGYLTDEAVAFDAEGRVRLYPKPLSLADASLRLLDLERRLPALMTGEGAEKRLVPATLLGQLADGPKTVSLVVLPERREGATLHAQEISRAEGLAELMGHLHSEAPANRVALDQLAAVLRSARCLRIVAPDSLLIARIIQSSA